MKPPSRRSQTATLLLLAIAAFGAFGCGGGSDGTPRGDGGSIGDAAPTDDGGGLVGRDSGLPSGPDVNADGTLNILIIGTSESIRQATGEFSPADIAVELQRILEGDANLGLNVNVVAEDIHATTSLDVGLGQGGTLYSYTLESHSLTQYYYWPDGRDARLRNLAGMEGTDWDQVIIGADPALVSDVPGFYALGVNKIADQVRTGDAQPRLLMVWPPEENATRLERIEEMTYRAAEGARTFLPVVPAALAWSALTAGQRDQDANQPTPNGAYLAAATIYAELLERSASSSSYEFDDAIADVALATVSDAASRAHYEGLRDFVSPFAPCGITDRVLNYNHTGTSSENGILGGLRWVLERARVQLQLDGDSPIDFNYGRANTNFEANKRYQIDPSRFEFSLGFPMQDHGSTGDVTMLYGIDQRGGETENGTDLGVAFKMIRDAELPEARAIPIRTLFAQMREANPGQSAYRDDWHMHRDLDRASAAFMYTLLTGHCALDAEPADPNSVEWRQWMAHRIGYETAWTVMHLRGVAPGFRVLPESAASVSVTPTQSAQLAISFANTPRSDVTVRLSSDNDGAVTYSPSTLVFTPANHATAQTVTMTATAGGPASDTFTIAATTESADPDFNGWEDRWEYGVTRP